MDASVIKFNSGMDQINKNFNKFNMGVNKNYKSLNSFDRTVKNTEKSFNSFTKSINNTQKCLEQAFRKPVTIEFQTSTKEIVDDLKESFKDLVKSNFQISVEVENKTVINSMKDMCAKPKEVSNAFTKSEQVITNSFDNISKKSDDIFGKMKDKISNGLGGLKGKFSKAKPETVGKFTYKSKEKIKAGGRFRFFGKRREESAPQNNTVSLEKGGGNSNRSNQTSSRSSDNTFASGRARASISRTRTVTATYSAGDAATSPGIFKRGASLLGSGILTAAKGAVEITGRMMSSGNELQHQKTDAMQTIRNTNKGKSLDEVSKITDNFIKSIQKDASKSPFRQSEMINAGNKALKSTNGDTNAAREMVKVAQSMVAANSGTNLNEAISALQSLKSGDASKMAQFGINPNDAQNGIKQNGGVDGYINSIGNQFAPDLENYTNSPEGQISMLQGKFDESMSNGGSDILESMVPMLEGANTLIDALMPNIETIASGFSQVMGDVFTWIAEHMPEIQETLGNVFDWLSEKFGWISGESAFLKEVFSSVWGGIKEVMSTAWTIIGPIFDLIGNGALLLYELFKIAFPGVKQVIESVWGFIGPILEKLGSLIGSVADGVGKFVGWLGDKIGVKTKKTDHNALGTSYFSGGLTTVDEHGGELKILPNGTKIIPHDLSENILNNNGGNNFSIVVNAQNMSTDQVVNDLVPKLKLALANM